MQHQLHAPGLDESCTITRSYDSFQLSEPVAISRDAAVSERQIIKRRLISFQIIKKHREGASNLLEYIMDVSTRYFVSRYSGIRMVLVVVMIALLLQISDHQVQAQGANCSDTLSDLNVCAPFVMMTGATNVNPSADCCAALQSADQDCFCNTLRIASQIPNQCNLPPLSCSGI